MANTIDCGLCGHTFDPIDHPACPSCPLQTGCTMVCCPNCGFETVNVTKSKLAQGFKRLVEMTRKNNPNVRES